MKLDHFLKFQTLDLGVRAIIPSNWEDYIHPSSHETCEGVVNSNGFLTGNLTTHDYQSYGQLFVLRVYNGTGTKVLKFVEFPTEAIIQVGNFSLEKFVETSDDFEIQEGELVCLSCLDASKHIINIFLVDDSGSMEGNKLSLAKSLVADHMTHDYHECVQAGNTWEGHIKFLNATIMNKVFTDPTGIADHIEPVEATRFTPLCRRIVEIANQIPTEVSNNVFYKIHIFTDGMEFDSNNGFTITKNFVQPAGNFVRTNLDTEQMTIALMCVNEDKHQLTDLLGVHESNVLGFSNDAEGIKEANIRLELSTAKYHQNLSRGTSVVSGYFSMDEV
jgi:hypothetical protein